MPTIDHWEVHARAGLFRKLLRHFLSLTSGNVDDGALIPLAVTPVAIEVEVVRPVVPDIELRDTANSCGLNDLS